MLAELTLLVWNVHGLPFIGASPEAVRKFVDYANHYELVLAQEAWTPAMRKKLNKQAGTVFKSDSRSGLVTRLGSLFFNHELSHYEHYRFKTPRTFSKFDFLVKKGFTIQTIDDSILVVNTHLDAGRDMASVYARASQLDEIMDVLVRMHWFGPIVLAGDLNLKKSDPYDSKLIELLKKNGFTEVVSSGTDYIFTFGNVKVKNADIIANDISDHKALSITLEYEEVLP